MSLYAADRKRDAAPGLAFVPLWTGRLDNAGIPGQTRHQRQENPPPEDRRHKNGNGR